jgi:membrane protease subunit HflC
MNRLIAIGVAAVVILYLLFSSLYIVNVREQAIVMRFGRITDIKEDPGIYFKIPTSIVDSVQIVENRLLRYDIANLTLQVSGGKFYVVDAFLTYRISDPRLFRERALGDLRVVEDRIATRFDAALRQVYGKRDFNAALSEQRTAMMVEARDLMVGEMSQLGVDIVDVRILRTDLTQQVSAQTYDRMKAERLAEAALLRARGQEQAQTLKAIADRQAVEIVAAARRDAEILRGQGDAQRSEVYAQAYEQDPDFFAFYRSMQAYRTAMGENGTTMVLSPNSEFFKYFGSVPGATDTSDAANIKLLSNGTTPAISMTPPAGQDLTPNTVPPLPALNEGAVAPGAASPATVPAEPAPSDAGATPNPSSGSTIVTPSQ